MFKLKQTNTFTWPVEVYVASDGGKFDKQTLDIEFKRLPLEHVQELQAREGMTDALFCKHIVIGWSGVVDESTPPQPVPFSEAALAEALSQTGVPTAIVLAYHQASAGLKRKNS